MPKSLELEHRLSRLELRVNELQQTIERLLRRNAALQAELDHLAAKSGRELTP